ncbi:LOW QUALITY PROTEIN: hypothetical protein MXB_2791 [Myxobolus squamalis]|nr:LOW QUALITY PROTEIN: hypothetical protein MXB_2791 [Myxobolus squamalis]
MDSDDFISSHARLFKHSGKGFESRRDQIIQKKRNQIIPLVDNTDGIPITTVEQIIKLANDCSSPELEIFRPAIMNLRLYLSVEKAHFIDELLSRNIVDSLIKHLSPSDSGDIKYNVAWALTNIASGSTEHTAFLLKEDVIGALGRLLYDPNPTLVEQAIWALSNIMAFLTLGDGPYARMFLLRANILSVLPSVLASHLHNVLIFYHPQATVMKQFSWMLINLCRKKEADVPIQFVPQIVPLLLTLLEIKDESVICDVLWAVTHLADSSQTHITYLVSGGLVARILPLLNASPKLALCALRAAGNVAASTDEHTQYLLDNGIYQYLAPHFNTTIQKIKKELYWLLSNIAAGSRQQMLTLFSLNLFPQIIRDLELGEFQVKREACWVISNVMHVQPFIDSNILIFMKKFLESGDDTQMISVVLEFRCIRPTTKNITFVRKSKNLGVIASLLTLGLDVIENLQSHSNQYIYGLVTHILVKYFSEDAEDVCVDSALTDPPTSAVTDLSVQPQNENRYHF